MLRWLRNVFVRYWTARVTYALTEKAELHGYELFHGDKEWAPAKNTVRARIGLYRRALQVIAEHADALVICGERSSTGRHSRRVIAINR